MWLAQYVAFLEMLNKDLIFELQIIWSKLHLKF